MHDTYKDVELTVCIGADGYSAHARDVSLLPPPLLSG